VNGLAGHAFISYVREDGDRVDRLQAALDDAGVRVWRDTAHLWPGQDWRAEIRKAITADSLAFIACFSGSSGQREVTYQSQELSLAVEQMRLRAPGTPWLIPVRFAPCDIPDLDLGEGRRLTSLQHVDLFDGSWERGIPRLLRAVLGVLQDRPAPLHLLLERSGLEAALTDVLGAAGAAGGDVSPLLRGLARRQIESVTCFLRQLPAGGDIVYDGEDRDWLLGLTSEAQRSINATSLVTTDGGAKGFDGGLWTSDLGARYLDRQREAIDRNVRVRRVFVFENENLARDEACIKITQMHRDIGVDVRMLHHRLIPPWLHWALSDFIVFDSAVCYEITFHFHGWVIRPAIVRTSLSTTPDRVRDLEKSFDQLWQAADPDRQAS
jgi:TIR domain